MNGPAPDRAPAESAEGIERRQAERSRLPLTVRCSVAPGRTAEATLVDVSLSGCQLRARRGLLAPGARIVLRPDAMPALPGVVCWAVGDAAGMQFDLPLHEAILRHLLYEPAEDQQGWSFVDGFGRKLPGLGGDTRRAG